MQLNFIGRCSTNRLPQGPREVMSSRRLTILGLLTMVAALSLANLAPVSALTVDELPITRVEEDWEIDIATPHSGDVAPQITTVMSPRADLDHSYIVFELNHATQPAFQPGGMQLQCWYGNNFVCSSRHLETVPLTIADEHITFTTTMTLSDHWLRFEVENGNSTTWGTFGKGLSGNLKQWWYSSLENLNQYNPQMSVENSRVGFASHRVKKLQLKAVRYYSGDTLVQTDTTPKIVWEHAAQE
jgi:hypothetical protein